MDVDVPPTRPGLAMADTVDALDKALGFERGRRPSLDGASAYVALRNPATDTYFCLFGESHAPEPPGGGYCAAANYAEQLSRVRVIDLIRRYLRSASPPPAVDLFLEKSIEGRTGQAFGRSTSGTLEALVTEFRRCNIGDCQYPSLHVHYGDARGAEPLLFLMPTAPVATPTKNHIVQFLRHCWGALSFDKVRASIEYNPDTPTTARFASLMVDHISSDHSTRTVRQLFKLMHSDDIQLSKYGIAVSPELFKVLDDITRAINMALDHFAVITLTSDDARITFRSDVSDVVAEAVYKALFDASLLFFDLYTVARGIFAQHQRRSMVIVHSGSYHTMQTARILRGLGFEELVSISSTLLNCLPGIYLSDLLRGGELEGLLHWIAAPTPPTLSDSERMLLTLLATRYDDAIRLPALEPSVSIFDIMRNDLYGPSGRRRFYLLRVGDDALGVFAAQAAVCLYRGFFTTTQMTLQPLYPRLFAQAVRTATDAATSARLLSFVWPDAVARAEEFQLVGERRPRAPNALFSTLADLARLYETGAIFGGGGATTTATAAAALAVNDRIEVELDDMPWEVVSATADGGWKCETKPAAINASAVPRHAALRQPLAGGQQGVVVEPVRVVDGDTVVVRVVAVPDFGYEQRQWRRATPSPPVEGLFEPLPRRGPEWPPEGRVTLTVAPGRQYARRIVIEPGALLRLRLSGIDAPESKMPYGQEARAALDELVRRTAGEGDNKRGAGPPAPGFNGTLTIWVNDVDRYGRLVALLYNHAVGDINAAMVARGAAWVYDRYEPVPNTYYLQEQTAKEERLGLWAATAEPQPPWEWRQERRRARGIGCDRCGGADATMERRSTAEQLCGACCRQ